MKKIPIKVMCTATISLLPTIIIDFKKKAMLVAFLCVAVFINDKE